MKKPIKGRLSAGASGVFRSSVVLLGLVSPGMGLAAGTATNLAGAVSVLNEGTGNIAGGETTPARLQAYRAAELRAAAARDVVASRQADLDALLALSDAQVATRFPDGGFEPAVAAAQAALRLAEDAGTDAEDQSSAALSHLTAGRQIAPDSLAQLHAILGL